MGEPYWDPFDPDLHHDPYETWRRLRDEAPVFHNEKFDFYALSRYGDVLEASLDTETFSSSHGITLDDITTDDRPPPNPMIMMDPPDHTGLRKLVNRTFTPRRMAALEEYVHRLCDRYLDPFVGAGGFDYVQDFSMKLPVMVISSLLGFPEEDHDQLREWSDSIIEVDAEGEGAISNVKAGESDGRPRSQVAFDGMMGYYADQVARRRKAPTDDIVSDLMAAELVEPDGTARHLDDGELIVFIAMINFAGNETVARLLGWAGLTLARYPAERAKMVADPDLIPKGIEELLRFEAPSPVQGRFTLRDATIHDTLIPAGSKVALITGSAGRDEREFARADTYDIERADARHVSFGYGAHYCLGAALARVEGKVGLAETLKRFPTWEVDEDAVTFVHTNSVRGPKSVPIHT